MWHNDHNISATTPTTYNTRLQHRPSDRDTVWGPSSPPKTASREVRGEVRARAKYAKGLRFMKKKMQGVPPYTR